MVGAAPLSWATRSPPHVAPLDSLQRLVDAGSFINSTLGRPTASRAAAAVLSKRAAAAAAAAKEAARKSEEQAAQA